MELAFASVADTSARSAGAIILLLAVRHTLRGRVSARLLGWVWLALALRLLLPVAVPAPWSPFNLLPRPELAISPAVPPPGPGPELATPPPATGDTTGVGGGTRAGPGGLTTAALLRGSAIVWAAGVVLLLFVRLAAHVSFARLVRRTAGPAPAAALPAEVARTLANRGIPVVITSAVEAPALHGMFRPRILFPPGLIERLTPAELRLTLAHELGHASRRDLLADALLHLATVVHWFNPFVWLAAREARRDCELACDEFVVGRATDHDRTAYGATLLKLSSLLRPPCRPTPGLGVVTTRSHLKRRIQMIVAHRPTALPAAILGVAACTALLALSFTRSVARPGAEAHPLPAPVPPAVAETLSAPGAAPHAAHDDGDRLDQLFPSGVVATVNDHAITVADVRLQVAPLLPALRQEARSPEEFAGRLQLLHNSAIKDLVNRAVLIRQFRETRDGDLPRQVAPEQVDTYLADEVRERFGGDRARFLAYLRARNLTVRDYRREVEEDIIYRYMRAQERKLANSSSAPPANPADKPVRLRIIQLTRTAEATDASLLARAQEIVARFRAGEAFAQLAQEFDQSGRRARGGDWGWIGPADLKPAFRESVMGLAKGQAAEPILLPEGCFLLYADDRR